MPRLAFTAVWLVVCLTSTLRAQTEAVRAAVPADSAVKSRNPADSADVLLVEVDQAVGSLEPVWVFLQKGQAYRVEVTLTGLTLNFRTPAKNIEAPFFSAVEGQRRPSGGSTFEVYPRADAMYEIRIIAASLDTPFGTPTTIKLYRDISASRNRQKVIASGWDIGMEVAFGMHSAYPITRPSFSEPAPVGEAGTDVDLCFSARGGASSRSRFSACAVGLGYQSRPGAESGVVWVFTEPRLRIVGKSAGRSAFEAGILTRVGIGIVSGVNVDPVSVAPGLYVARQIRREGAGGGWNLMASYARVWISGTDGARSNRFAIGLGRF